MSAVRASAPGKLVLCGEYVVLDGAPAIAVAMNCRSVVSAQTVAGRQGRCRCPGFDDRVYSYSTDAAGNINWQGGNRLQLMEMAAAAFPGLPALEAVLDTSAFFAAASGDKLGLGSSASLSVSLMAAMARLAGDEAGPDAAHSVHRRFQNGRGSGIDVASCHAGGVIEFSIDRRSKPRKISWPDGLHLALFWTGVPSSTCDRIIRFEASGNSASRARLARASADVIDAFTDADDTLQATASYVDALQSFDDDLDLDIFSEGHEYLRELAQKYPVVYKPCGAGGGDVGIALATKPAALEGFALAAATARIERLDVQIDIDGLIVEEWYP